MDIEIIKIDLRTRITQVDTLVVMLDSQKETAMADTYHNYRRGLEDALAMLEGGPVEPIAKIDKIPGI